jgi:hypothetical protein
MYHTHTFSLLERCVLCRMQADESRDRLLCALATAEFAYTHSLAVCCDAVCKPMVDAQKTLAPAAFKMRDVRWCCSFLTWFLLV